MSAKYPNNTSSHYTTVLTDPIVVKETKSVGLLGIQFPLTFYNVENFFYIKLITHNGKCKITYLREGVYENPTVLKDMINIQLSHAHLVFKTATSSGFDEKRFVLEGNHNIKEIELHQKLARLMGMESCRVESNKMVGAYDYDPWINHKVIFVNVSGIQHIFSNNEPRQILQSVVLPRKINFGDTFSVTYDEPEYLQFEGERHPCLTISLTDYFNDLIRLRSGTVITKLMLL